MKVFRWTLVIVTLAFATYAIDVLTIRPFRCNTAKQEFENLAQTMWNKPHTYRLVLAARRGVVRMQECIKCAPTDIDTYMTLGLHQRLLGQFEAAEKTYEAALKYDRRPELYLNLGLMQLQLGKRQQAIASFTRAANFDFQYTRDITDEELQSTVIAQVLRQRADDPARARSHPR